MEISLINYSTGPIKANTELWEKLPDKTNMEIGVHCRLRYTPGIDVFGVQFDLIVTNNDKLIVKMGFLFGMAVINFNEFLNDSFSQEKNRRAIEEILQFIWPYAMGAFAARCADNSIKMLLPPVDYAKLAEDVIIKKTDKEELAEQ